MNLLTKTTLLYLLLALVVFGIGGLAAYRMVQKEVQKETEFSLIEGYYQVVHSIKAGVSLEALRTDKVNIQVVSVTEPVDTQFVFTDTLAMHPLLKRLEPYRMLTTIRPVNGQYYKVSLMDVFLEADDIEEVVTNIMTDLFLILGGVFLVFSFFISRWLFRPFQTTLQKIKGFNINSGSPPDLPKTTTSEFRQLNSFLTSMLNKIGKDYRTLKEFSENASHEMQTPLAIARGKLELLMETQGLTEEQLRLVEETEYSLDRLTKLGEALLLLTKIENREFTTHQAVDFSKIIQTETQSFEELAGMKGLGFKSEVEPGVQIRIDATLAQMLVSNLFKNAIRHNVDEGWISVKLDKERLTVRNSGKEPPVPTQQLFERFQKSNQSARSLGLGLAIVKKICEASDFEISYDYREGVHEITVKF